MDVNLTQGGFAWGLVSFSRDNEEGYFCGNTWQDKNTDMICKELGFSTGERLSASHRNLQVSDESRFIIDLDCEGSENDLGWCPYELDNSCATNGLVLVSCHDLYGKYLSESIYLLLLLI